MSKPSQAERIEFWKSTYARASFVQTHLLCRRLLDRKQVPPELVDGALCTAAMVMYARPFKQRPKVKLDAAVVPAGHKGLHDRVIEYRDKVVAHRDLDGPATPWGIVSEVMLDSDGTGFELHTTSVLLEPQTANELASLAGELVELMNVTINRFVEAYVPRPLAAGIFHVSLEEDPADWLVPQRPRSS